MGFPALVKNPWIFVTLVSIPDRVLWVFRLWTWEFVRLVRFEVSIPDRVLCVFRLDILG